MDLSLFYFLATDRKGMGNDETIQKKYDDMFGYSGAYRIRFAGWLFNTERGGYI